MKRCLWLAVVAVLHVSSASATIVNGNFASGDFAGWSTLVVSPALGASAVVVPLASGNRAVLTAAATSTSTATAGLQQAFSISRPQRLALDFGSDQSLAGLASKQAGNSQVSIFVSKLSGSWSHNWTYTLYNDPAQSLASLSIPFGSVSTVIPQAGNYLLYAQVQAADGAPDNDAYAQLTLSNIRLLAVPEPTSGAMLLIGIGVAIVGIAMGRRWRLLPI